MVVWGAIKGFVAWVVVGFIFSYAMPDLTARITDIAVLHWGILAMFIFAGVASETEDSTKGSNGAKQMREYEKSKKQQDYFHSLLQTMSDGIKEDMVEMEREARKWSMARSISKARKAHKSPPPTIEERIAANQKELAKKARRAA